MYPIKGIERAGGYKDLNYSPEVEYPIKGIERYF
jgi:hypothetical protein